MNNYDNLWNEIFERFQQPEDRQPYEKTFREMLAETKLTERTLRRRLDMLIAEGKMTCRSAIVEKGRKCFVYAPVISKDDADLDQDAKQEKSN